MGFMSFSWLCCSSSGIENDGAGLQPARPSHYLFFSICLVGASKPVADSMRDRVIAKKLIDTALNFIHLHLACKT